VAQGVIKQAEEAPQTSQQEERGKGVNATVFWVTNNLMSDWIQLPEAQPEHICAARNVVHLMSGHLNASIDCNPPFPGKERHFLRAQLARI
jgi:radial spoke head protein 4A